MDTTIILHMDCCKVECTTHPINAENMHRTNALGNDSSMNTLALNCGICFLIIHMVMNKIMESIKIRVTYAYAGMLDNDNDTYIGARVIIKTDPEIKLIRLMLPVACMGMFKVQIRARMTV